MNKIFKTDDINFNHINYLRSNKIKNDIVIPIYYKFEEKKYPLLIQVPSLYLNDPYNGKDTLILPLKGRSEHSTKIVSDFFNELDATIVISLKKILYDLKKEKTHGIDFSNISYKSIVNEIEGDDNEIYINGLIRYKLYNSNEFKTKIFDEDKNLLKPNEYNKMSKGVYIKSIIEINSLVLRDNIIHVYIKPHQLRIFEEKLDTVNLESYSFIDSEEEIKNNDTDIVLNTQTDYLEPNKLNIETESTRNNFNNATLMENNKEKKDTNNYNEKADLEKNFNRLCDESINSDIRNHLLCENMQDYSSDTDNFGNMLQSELNNIEEDDDDSDE